MILPVRTTIMIRKLASMYLLKCLTHAFTGIMDEIVLTILLICSHEYDIHAFVDKYVLMISTLCIYTYIYKHIYTNMNMS